MDALNHTYLSQTHQKLLRETFLLDPVLLNLFQ